MPNNLHRATINSREVARTLGMPAHLIQVTALGMFPNRAMFVQALIAAGLSHGTPSRISRYIATYSGPPERTPDPERYADVLATPGQLFVEPLSARKNDPCLPWPERGEIE